MQTRHLKLGLLGESKAVDHLIKKKYQIVERNWKLKKYEIDIIAIDNEELVFIEVKTRSNSLQQLGEIITTSQQKRIISAADSFIKENKIDLDVRFDMILIEKTIKSYKFTHIKEIFFPTFD